MQCVLQICGCVLQCVAVCCSELQRVAVLLYSSIRQYIHVHARTHSLSPFSMSLARTPTPRSCTHACTPRPLTHTHTPIQTYKCAHRHMRVHRHVHLHTHTHLRIYTYKYCVWRKNSFKHSIHFFEIVYTYARVCVRVCVCKCRTDND